MSSTYRILCMSHDPAIMRRMVTDWQDVADDSTEDGDRG